MRNTDLLAFFDVELCAGAIARGHDSRNRAAIVGGRHDLVG